MYKFVLRFSFALTLFLYISCNQQNHASTGTPQPFSTNSFYPCLCEKKVSENASDSIKKTKDIRVAISRIDSLFTQKALAGFNGGVLIAKNNVVLYNKMFGYENYETKKPLSFNSKFQLASISKQFTAVVIMKLVKENQLSLTNTVDYFFPDFPYKNIKIQDLLSHRSGLPEYMHVFSYKIKPYTVAYNQDILNWLIAEKPPVYFPVNTRFEYCNTNYCLLSLIVEKVTKQHFSSYMRDSLFVPLGMNDTYISTTDDITINSNRTLGYSTKWVPFQLDFFDGVVGDKGVYTTIKDMYTWSLMLNSNCFLDNATLNQMFEPRSFEKPGRKNYGYGFRMLDADKPIEKIVYHNGWWKGYNTSFCFSQKKLFTIIILSNKLNKSVYQTQPIIDILNGRYGSSDTTSLDY